VLLPARRRPDSGVEEHLLAPRVVARRQLEHRPEPALFTGRPAGQEVLGPSGAS
jgi:hypothetical protein